MIEYKNLMGKDSYEVLGTIQSHGLDILKTKECSKKSEEKFLIFPLFEAFGLVLNVSLNELRLMEGKEKKDTEDNIERLYEVISLFKDFLIPEGFWIAEFDSASRRVVFFEMPKELVLPKECNISFLEEIKDRPPLQSSKKRNFLTLEEMRMLDKCLRFKIFYRQGEMQTDGPNHHEVERVLFREDSLILSRVSKRFLKYGE